MNIPFKNRFFFRVYRENGGWTVSILLGFIWINIRENFPSPNCCWLRESGLYLGWARLDLREGDVIPGKAFFWETESSMLEPLRSHE